jgi:intracellular sulfur oxidation DsrE/DsrF family protein
MIRLIRPSRPALISALCFILSSAAAVAAERVYLEVSPADREDLSALFTTLEESLEEGIPMSDPVIIVLHGSEALPFTNAGYSENRQLVDRAARLDAYRLIDVKMCESWMSDNGVAPEEIPAFIETVPYAPEEIERLEAEGFVPLGKINI